MCRLAHNSKLGDSLFDKGLDRLTRHPFVSRLWSEISDSAASTGSAQRFLDSGGCLGEALSRALITLMADSVSP